MSLWLWSPVEAASAATPTGIGPPTWTVELAFGYAPLNTAPVWVDVTAYVLHEEGISVEFGRSSALSDFRTGEAFFTLRNDDRRFDPLHASGPYFGQLLPNVQVRITATASTGQVQFRGFVRGWPQSFAEGGKRAVVEVECYDGLGWLSEARANDDLVYEYADSIGSLDYFWRQASAAGYVDAVNSVVAQWAQGTGGISTAPMPGVSGDALTFTGKEIIASAGSGKSASLWFQTTSTTATKITGAATTQVSPAYAGGIYLTATGQITARDYIPTVYGDVRTTAGGGWNDGRWHHLVVVGCAASGAGFTIYVDGVSQALDVSGAISGVSGIVVDLSSIGGTQETVDATQAVTYVPSFIGQIADVAAWDVYLSDAQVQGIYERSLATFTESTTARAGRILDSVGWPSAWRALSATPAGTCTGHPFNGSQASNELREVERTEQGRMFVSKDGNVTLLDRYHTTTNTRGNTIQATFSDDGSDVGYSVTSIVQDVDDVLNDVTVSIELTGGSSNSSNTTSITNLGRKSETVNTLLPNLALAGDMAAGIVAQRKDALSRVAPVAPHFNQSLATWETLLGLRIGDRVRLEMTPSGVGSQFQQSATVEGIRIAAGLDRTLIEFVAAPLPAVTWFTCDSSQLDGSHVVAF